MPTLFKVQWKSYSLRFKIYEFHPKLIFYFDQVYCNKKDINIHNTKHQQMHIKTHLI
jgi:hypothetical protein